MKSHWKCLALATVSLLTVSIPHNSVQADEHDQNLRKLLTSQNNSPAALEIAEQGRTTELVHLSNVTQIRQVAQQQNATLVQYSIINDELLYIWVIKPTGEIAFRSSDLKPIRQKENTSLIDVLCGMFNYSSCSSAGVKKITVTPVERTDDHDKLHNLQKLHQILIQPIAEFLPNQPDERIIFIPQGDLFLVPFAALQNAQGKYLIEQHTIATAPSIQALDLLYQRRQQISGVAQDILVVGNPTMPKPLPNYRESGNLSQLPGAEQEANNIGSIFNTPPLIGDAATKTAVLQRMPQAGIIHIATSAFYGPNNQLKLALADSNEDDGWLTSQEIENLNLQAKLVVLSSCDTAIGKITGDGVDGLSRSFFTAGVPTFIGALWNIEDIATASLMTEFYQKYSENLDKAAALRHAMLETMQKNPDPQFWAGFTLIGTLD